MQNNKERMQTMNSKKNIRSHAKKRKILWGRIFTCLFLIVLLIGIAAVSIVLFLKRDDSVPPESQSTAPSTSAAQTTLSSEKNSTIQKIIPSSDEIYLAAGRSKQITLQFSATSTENFNDVEWTSSDSSVASVDENGNITGISQGVCTVTASYGDVSSDINVTVRSLEVRNGITYIDDILIVNKEFSLPESYDPGDILPEVKESFDKMSEDAAKEGLNIYIGSSYRSYDYQVEIFNNYSEIYGEELANTFSSKPGHSEHQSGLTIDCNTIDSAFGDTREALWLAENAADYGFIVRFLEGKENITGYTYEPWHIRYVGVETAKEIYSKGLTLEEYLGVDKILDTATSQDYHKENDISEGADDVNEENNTND